MKQFRSCFLALVSILIFLESVNGNECERRQPSKEGSSVPGDYRTAASGTWSSRTTWERFDGTGWVTPAAAPDSSSGTITVRNGHTVTISASVIYDQLVVETGGQVTVASGVTHSLSDGPGVDLTIEGTWLNQGGTWSISGGAKWSVAVGGTFIQNTTSGISTPLSKATLDKQSNFIYCGGSTLVPSTSFSGRNYGNLSLESDDGSWTCTASGGGALNVGGDLTIGAGVRWITGGFSGAITIEGATTIQGEWSGSGSGNQGAHVFAGNFLVSFTGKYQLSTSGSGQGAIFFRGNLTNDGTFSLPANRLVIMDGSQLQTIGGASPLALSFWNLHVENDCGISMGQPTSVHNSLSLKAGNVRMGHYVLTLEPGASLDEPGLGSVLGTVETKRLLERGKNETFGNSGGEIRPSNEFNDSVIVRRTTGSAPMIAGAKSISRYYEISTAGPTLDAEVNFHYCSAELNGTNESILQVYRSTDSGASWSNVGGSVSASEHILRWTGRFSSSRWAIAEQLLPPTIDRISPNCGSQGTSPRVVLTGGRLDVGGMDVRFSGAGIAVQWLSIDSPVQITMGLAIAKDAELGSRDFTLTTLAGTAMLRNAFEVTQPPNPRPVLNSILPSLGIRGRTISVMLSGDGLVENVTSVSLGEDIAVLALHTETPGLRASLAVAPSAHLGARTLTISNPPPGGGTLTLPGAFTVVNPVPIVTAVIPNVGVCGQQSCIDVVGSDFAAENPTVSFGDGITVDSVNVVSPSTLKIRVTISPIAASGLRDCSVSNAEPGGGRGTLIGGFRVKIPEPKITAIMPAIGVRGASITLVVTGSDFLSGVTTLNLGEGFLADSVIVLSPTSMSGKIRICRGASAGFRNAIVMNPGPGGGSTTFPNAFEVTNPSPTIASVSPQVGVRGASVAVEVRGSGFIDQVTAIDFGTGVSTTGVVCDSSGERLCGQLTVSSSAMPGERVITITNAGPGGGTSSTQNVFTIVNPVPTITGVIPSGCGQGQSERVTVYGTNFISGVTILTLIPGIRVDTSIVENATRITAVISVASDAVVAARGIRVTNPEPGGGSAVLPHVFNVENLRPQITRISPSVIHGPGQRDVTIAGAHFFPGVTRVSFGPGVMVDSVTVADSSHLRAFVSIREDFIPGIRTVCVSNPPPGGGTDSLMDGFVVESSLTSAVRKSEGITPEQYLLSDPYPNPFNPSTTIRLGLPEDSYVNLVIYNVLGCVVDRLVNGVKARGIHNFTWHPERHPSGMYLIRVIAESMESARRYVSSKRIMLLK